MEQTDTERLIGMLVLWWRYESQWSPVDGYPKECPSTAGYRASRQYDDTNGAFETDAIGRMAGAVGIAVSRVPDPWRTALHFLARNRATGLDVWSSARLPPNRADIDRITDEALEKIAGEV